MARRMKSDPEPDGITAISRDVPPEEPEKEEEPVSDRPQEPLSADNLSPMRVTVPGVHVQRPYKKLDQMDYSGFPFIGEIDVKDDTVTVERETRSEALRAASNVIAVTPGEWEQVSAFEVGTDEEPQYRIVLRRKE